MLTKMISAYISFSVEISFLSCLCCVEYVKHLSLVYKQLRKQVSCFKRKSLIDFRKSSLKSSKDIAKPTKLNHL